MDIMDHDDDLLPGELSEFLRECSEKKTWKDSHLRGLALDTREEFLAIHTSAEILYP